MIRDERHQALRKRKLVGMPLNGIVPLVETNRLGESIEIQYEAGAAGQLQHAIVEHPEKCAHRSVNSSVSTSKQRFRGWRYGLKYDRGAKAANYHGLHLLEVFRSLRR